MSKVCKIVRLYLLSISTPKRLTSIIDKSKNHLTHPKYRPDIDGLRAIAVLCVVCFHAFPTLLVGGFIGVDIFFVISGFLISTIIFDNLERGSFSFLEFYSRRINRIFPALLLVLISCFAFGWMALLADEYKQLGKHIAAGASFISNFVFLNESGYFDSAAETKPLLHLWTLGIEEQFYIIWPLLLWLAWKRKFNLLNITLIISVASFVLNIKGVSHNPIATFYSPQTRFWELLAGSVLAYTTLYKQNLFTAKKQKLNAFLNAAIYAHSPQDNPNTLRHIQSLIGTVVIIIGVLIITKSRHFPGTLALMPTLGAVLVISAGPQALINRLILSNRILVWFGLISFPLYLWHWPLLSFANIVESEFPSYPVRIYLILTSILLSWLTYLLIEKPIRYGKNSTLKTIILFLSMCAIGYIGYYTYQQEGFIFRKNAVLINPYKGDIGHTDFYKYVINNYFSCTPKIIADEAEKSHGFVRCAQSQQNENEEIALIGDSHAEHLFLGIAEAMPKKNVAFYIKSTTPYIDNPDFSTIYNYLVPNQTIKQVILTMDWTRRTTGITEMKILKTADALLNSGKKVYLTDDIPTFPFGPERCRGPRWPLFTSSICVVNRTNIYNLSTISMLQSIIKKDPRIKLIYTQKHLCNEIDCSMVKNDQLLYRDTNHLNINGSKYIGAIIAGSIYATSNK